MTRRQSAIIVLILLALGGAAAYSWMQLKERHREEALRAREAALKDNLFQMRKAIDNFYAENKRYPYSLEELVPRHMRRVPADPITGEANWRVTTEESVQPSGDFTTGGTAPSRSEVIEVHSAAGKPYSDY